MGAKLIVQMDGKKTRLQKLRRNNLINDGANAVSLRDALNDFTFDHSYWSFDTADGHFTTQEQVYEDLGTDVINCAFQGK